MHSYVFTSRLKNKIIQIQELTYKQYRTFSKCFINDELDCLTVFANIDNLLIANTNLTQTEIDNLDFIDYFLLLLDIRINSIGDTVTLNYTSNSKEIKLSLDLNYILNDCKLFSLYNNKINLDEIVIILKHPTIKELIFLKENPEFFFNTFFIKNIFTKKQNINLFDYSYEDREKIIQQLSVKTISILNQKIVELFETVYNYNIFKTIDSSFFSETLTISPNIDILSYIAKLLFYNNFESIYENIFVLCKAGNLSAEFLDKCSPGEVIFFIKKLEEYNQQTNNNTTDISSDNALPPITSEFGDEF
jgi:hypothetical protein